MTDHQLEPESAPQRKRIAVACGRCRKRKIRCSGDPGQGQPCSNCKNAGAEGCQFLRVSSREAPFRIEAAGDFGYSVGDARLFAGRASVQGAGLQYTQEAPTSQASNQDVLGSYRGGSTYAYTSPSKTYYPAMHAYAPTYGDEFEFGLGVSSSPSMLSPDPVGILPGQWSSGLRTKPASFSSAAGVYLDTEAPYGSYTSTSLVHRPGVTASSDSPNFSFSNVAASLPMSNAAPPGGDRLLPNPAARSAALPYPTAIKPSISGAPNSSTLADVATAATYAAGGFENHHHGLHYQAPAAANLGNQAPPPPSSASTSSRTSSDPYPTAAETLFGEQDRAASLQSQEPQPFEMHPYTTEPRRGSGGESGGASSSSSSNGGHSQGAYGTGPESVHTHHQHQHHHQAAVAVSAPAHHHHHHPHHHHHHMPSTTSYSLAGGGGANGGDDDDVTSSTGHHALRHGQPPGAPVPAVASRQ